MVLADANSSFVMALFSSGLQELLWDVVKQVDRVVVVISDSPENMLSRITFYDVDSKQIDKTLDEHERELHLEDIRKDIAYYRRSFRKADMVVDIEGLNAAQSTEKVELALREWASMAPNAPRLPRP